MLTKLFINNYKISASSMVLRQFRGDILNKPIPAKDTIYKGFVTL